MRAWINAGLEQTDRDRFYAAQFRALSDKPEGHWQFDMREFRTPLNDAFDYFGEDGIRFLTNELLRPPSWMERNHSMLRGKLPKFSHRWLPSPDYRADGAELSVQVLRMLGMNAVSAQSAIWSAINTRKDDIMSYYLTGPPHVHALVSSGGNSQATVDYLFDLLSSVWDTPTALAYLQSREIRPIAKAMLPAFNYRALSLGMIGAEARATVFEVLDPQGDALQAYFWHMLNRWQNPSHAGISCRM